MKLNIIKIDLDIFLNSSFIKMFSNIHKLSPDKFTIELVEHYKNENFKYLFWEINSNTVIFAINRNKYEEYDNLNNISEAFYYPNSSVLNRLTLQDKLGYLNYDYDTILNKFINEGFEGLLVNEINFLKIYITNEHYNIFYENFNLDELKKELEIEVEVENYEKASIIKNIISKYEN